MRRGMLVAGAAALVMLASGCTASPTGPDADPLPDTSGVTTPSPSATADPTPAGSCAARLVNPLETVDGAAFGDCVAAAMTLGQSARVTTEFDDGTSAEGDVRFAGPFAVQLVYSTGQELIIEGDEFWYLGDEGVWVTAADVGTSVDASVGQAAASVMEYLASPQLMGEHLATSDWEPTGETLTVDGRETEGYRGAPLSLGVQTDEVIVWLDSADHPMRIETTATAFGVTVVGFSTYTDWGKTVEIEPPR